MIGRPKSFTLDGRRYRLDPLIPLGTIERRVRREHVGTSDDRIARIIRDAATGQAQWFPDLVRQAELYALACHRKNQRLYCFVITGGRSK